MTKKLTELQRGVILEFVKGQYYSDVDAEIPWETFENLDDEEIIDNIYVDYIYLTRLIEERIL